MISLFFIFFIFVCSFFLVNLFTGSLLYYFKLCENHEKNKFSFFMTDHQIKWMELQKIILNTKPVSKYVKYSHIRKTFAKFVTSNFYEFIITASILLNIYIMIAYRDDMLTEDKEYFDYLSNVLNYVFIFETLLKILILKFEGYFSNKWYVFEFLLTVFALIDILFQFFNIFSMKVFTLSSKISRIFKIFRILRVLRLTKQFKSFQTLWKTIIFSLPSLGNVGALILLIFFVYSILGCFLFSDIIEGKIINNTNNFSNFGNSLITLFRVLTGEDWYKVMYDCIKGKTSVCQGNIYCEEGIKNIEF